MQSVVQPSVVSLFAGIGGFDLGFDHAGFRIVGHVEKDANCRKLLGEKWPDAVCLDDVCTAGAHNLPPCDVVTFGFPCQDLSVAGKRAGLAGGRSGLFYEATRIIDELKPAYCLFENVPGLLSSDGGRDFWRVLRQMDEIGYHGAWRTLDAQWFGVAQRRRRVFGLFSRLDSGAERCAKVLSLCESLRGHPAPSRETGKVAPCLTASGVGAGRTGNERNEVDFCIEQATMPTLPSESGGNKVCVSFAQNQLGEVRTGDVAGTVNTNSNASGRNTALAQIAMSVRRLTPTECERLQGFPDGWTAGFSDSTRYKMLGNAVCVNVSEWIAFRLNTRITDSGKI